MAELESKPFHKKKKTYTHVHDDTDDSSQNGPAVRLRFYGKEKVRMNRTKAIQTRGFRSGHASKCAERMIVDLTLQWPGFPNNNNNNNSQQQQQQQQQESEMIMDDVVSSGTFVFPFTIQLPATLPSSTYYPINDSRRRSQMHFRIQYNLTASIVYQKGSSSTKSQGYCQC